MECNDLFKQQHIHDVLKSTFVWFDNSDISFFVDKSSDKENFILLTVIRDDVEQTYVLVKVPENLQPREFLQEKSPKVLYPVFILKSIYNEWYGAFECQHGMKHFLPPQQNNIECLKTILHNLAEYQAYFTCYVTVKSSEYRLKDITDPITSSDFFKDLDASIISNSIDNLQKCLNKLLNGSDFLVRSIWWPFAHNVYVNQDINTNIFLTVGSTKTVPPAYDALLYIFALSDEQFRQEYFENLIIYYFESLAEALKKLQSTFASKVSQSYSEHQVKVLLPVVKFEIANHLGQLNKTQPQDILTNIFYFLKYPLINQEDIYEATRNKIGTTDYNLLDYSLVSLSEKNGHLGEYFHLHIKVKTQGKEQSLQLFAKFLITSIEAFEAVLKDGPSKKEHFFYTTLLPLLSKSGLDSLLNFAPKCYLSRVDWLLVLDDLIRDGFIGFKPNNVLNYDGLRAMVEKFANLHSCTLILEEILSTKSGKTVRLDDDYDEYFKETILKYGDEDSPLRESMDSTLEMLCYIVEKFPEVTEKLDVSPEEIRSRLKKLFLTLFSQTKKSNTIRNVINHGDVFIANMLFKYDGDNVISKGILVDFQMLRYTSPNYDLLVFLFYNSTKETRDKYFEILIEEYYQLVSANIRKFNFNPKIVFPKKIFEEDVHFMMSASLVGAFMYAHVLHIDSDFREEIGHDNEKFDYYFNKHKDELVNLSWKTKHYRIILKGLVEDIVDVIKNDF